MANHHTSTNAVQGKLKGLVGVAIQTTGTLREAIHCQPVFPSRHALHGMLTLVSSFSALCNLLVYRTHPNCMQEHHQQTSRSKSLLLAHGSFLSKLVKRISEDWKVVKVVEAEQGLVVLEQRNASKAN